MFKNWCEESLKNQIKRTFSLLSSSSMFFSMLNEDNNEDSEINYSKLIDDDLIEESITAGKIAFIVPLLEKIFSTKIEKHQKSEVDLITCESKLKLSVANFLKNAFSHNFILVISGKIYKCLFIIIYFRMTKLHQCQC